LGEALRLAHEYGVAVRFDDLGAWSDGELRAEYDPAVPEIRINRRVVESLPAAERERFMELAVGHELYHHREHIGEVTKLSAKSEREAAADAYALELLSEGSNCGTNRWV
jgi:hypothetical protein